MTDTTKVLAYELDYDTDWEPGMPMRGEPDYWEERARGMRAQARDQNMDDAWLDEDAFPGNYDDISFRLVPQHGDEVFYIIGSSQNGTVPNPLIFKGDIQFLDFLDYPYNWPLWPIMSEGMLNTLLSVRDFRHRTYPTRMDDSRLLGLNEPPESPSQAFPVVQTLEFLDAFDFDKSEYKLYRDDEHELYRNMEGVDTATKVVLKEPADGFPPLFRLKAKIPRLFVSAEAKAALEAAGTARGIEFTAVDEDYHW